MIGNIKKSFSAKNWYVEKQHLGYVKDVKDTCYMLHALYKIMSKMLKILKQAITDFNEFIAGLLEAAYSLNWGTWEIWGKG